MNNHQKFRPDSGEDSALAKSRTHEHQAAEDALRHYEILARHSRDIILFVRRRDGRIFEANQAALQAYGYTRAELLSLSIYELRGPAAVHLTEQHMDKADSEGLLFETEHRRKDGSTFPVEVSSRGMSLQGERVLLSIIRDITDRKRTEINQGLLTEVLRVLNRGGDLRVLIRDVLRLIRDTAQFDAVGLRLRQGEDCPYYEQNGFSGEFLCEENFLCARGTGGALVRDSQSRPVLECTCGLVLSGQIRPGMSCCTEGGSFWTNVSTELLALPRQEDPRVNPRNRCIHVGYQSVGLFPVKAGQQIIGLLQLNDRQEGRFTPELVAFYENLAQNLGLALQRATAEAALEQSEARLRLAQSHGGVGVWGWDTLSGKVEWEPEVEQLYGLGSGAIRTYAEWTKLVHPEDLARIEKERDEALAVHRPFDVEFRIRHASGVERWLVSRGSGLYDAAGRMFRVVGVNIDITERKRIELALREAQEQLRQHATQLEKIVAQRTAKLQETVAELEHFSYAIAHDMRAPLRAMLSFADLLKEECSGCPRTLSQQYFRRIQTASSRMDQLITDSLNYSKAVRQELVLEPVDLVELLNDLAETYPNLQPDKANIQIAPDLPLVLGNGAALTQCFSNLLGNAVKFAKPSTKPNICIRVEPSPRQVQGSASLIRVWVEDDGIGICQRELERIFGLFQRSCADREGTGIGLAIVRKVAQRMGGEVGVESEEGKGSRFWVDLVKAP
ncbi:MAG TPA: PAS domain S-box protein [Clostridia bacterium]|nr:PAS domain S-box protein [Clostridia bacterium]